MNKYHNKERIFQKMHKSFPTTTITSNAFTNMHELLSCTEEDNNEKAKEEHDKALPMEQQFNIQEDKIK